MEIIAFKKVKEPYGWLGNMAAYGIIYPLVRKAPSFRTGISGLQTFRFAIK